MPTPRTLRWVPALAGLALLTSAGALRAQSAPPPRALADSVRPFLVFAPKGEMWFVASNRSKRMVIDIGRVDLEVRRDSALAAAYREVVAARSHIQLGRTFTLRAPWGAERVRAAGVDNWNGRIVLTLVGSARLDSAAQGAAPVVATALLDSTTGVVESLAGSPRCARFGLSEELTPRLDAIRDSLVYELKGDGLPIYDRLLRRVTTSTSRIPGCFGTARVMLAVSLRAGASEWVRERIVLVGVDGSVQGLRVQDFRFRAHDLLHAVDADGDGIDDVATIGRTFLAGGTSVLRYDPKEQRLVRIASGFSWEDR